MTDNWQSRAVCRWETGTPPEVWTSNRKPRDGDMRIMRQLCSQCPVRRDCALEAVVTEAQAGVYAGVRVPARSEIASWAETMRQLRVIAGLPRLGEPLALAVPA